MQFTALTVLLAAAGLTIATPVPGGEPATEVTTSDLPAGVTFIASNAISSADNNKSKRGTPTDACIGTCWSGYSSGMVSFPIWLVWSRRVKELNDFCQQCFWNCWDGKKCGYSVGTCQDKRWNE